MPPFDMSGGQGYFQQPYGGRENILICINRFRTIVHWGPDVRGDANDVSDTTARWICSTRVSAIGWILGQTLLEGALSGRR